MQGEKGKGGLAGRTCVQPMGLLEAFQWIEQCGALSMAEAAWAREAQQRMGCRQFQTGLTHADRMRVIALGRRCFEARRARV